MYYQCSLYYAGDEEALPDDKARSVNDKADGDTDDTDKTKGDDDKTVGDDVPLVEPVEDTHNTTSVATDNVVMSEECVDDSRQQRLLPPAVSLSDAASPGPDHFPVPVTSPGLSPAFTPAPSPPPSSITTTATNALESSHIVIQSMLQAYM